MTWDTFIWFGAATAVTSAIGAALSFNTARRRYATAFYLLAIVIFGSFITGLWITLERPPLKTMGETRLWYSFFALIAGMLTYARWRYRWILSFSTILSTVFILINILKPQIHDQTLMPALQSPWFIPHVTVYMFSYSLLGCAFLIALYVLFKGRNAGDDMFMAADRLVYIGTAFLTFGMLSGSLWAKEAWGHYWSWDPKETWALITWLCYVGYIHLRIMGKGSGKMLAIVLIISFVCLQMCWWGVNYLPSAQGSVHTY